MVHAGNRLGESGGTQIADAMKVNKTIVHLDLGCKCAGGGEECRGRHQGRCSTCGPIGWIYGWCERTGSQGLDRCGGAERGREGRAGGVFCRVAW